MIRGEGDGEPLRRFTDRIEAVVRNDLRRRIDSAGVSPRVDLELVTKLRAGQVLSAVAWFLEHLDEFGPDEAAATVNQAAERGWAWAAGLEPEGPP